MDRKSNSSAKIARIILFVIILFIVFYKYFGMDLYRLFYGDEFKNGMVELGAYVSEKIDEGDTRIVVYAKNVNEEEIQNINEYITCINGTVEYFTILFSKGEYYKLQIDVSISDNYYAYECYKNGTMIPEDRQNAIQLYDKVSQILDSILNDNMTDYEKELAIHDYLVKNCAYGYPDEEDYAYRAYGALVLNQAVCNGYAEAFALLLKCADVNVSIVTGEAGGQLHAWNQVELDDKWYHVDATWNDPVPDKGNYANHTYFNVSDDVIIEDHKWLEQVYNECDSMEYNYFYKQNNYFNDYEEFKQNINKVTIKGNNIQFAIANYDESKSDFQYLFDYYGVNQLKTSVEVFDNYNVLNVFFENK